MHSSAQIIGSRAKAKSKQRIIKKALHKQLELEWLMW